MNLKPSMVVVACALLGQTSLAFHRDLTPRKMRTALFLAKSSTVARQKRVSNLPDWSKENDIK
jgi:hypothetical protein